MMVVVGVTVYYVIPLSFTLQLFALFLSIMNFILLGLVGGLAMISQSIQPYFQRAFLQCLLWYAVCVCLCVCGRQAWGVSRGNA